MDGRTAFRNMWAGWTIFTIVQHSILTNAGYVTGNVAAANCFVAILCPIVFYVLAKTLCDVELE